MPSVSPWEGASDAGLLLKDRIERATYSNENLRQQWLGDWSSLGERSDDTPARAHLLGLTLKRAGFSFTDMSVALMMHRDTTEWAKTTGLPNGAAGFYRIWGQPPAEDDAVLWAEDHDEPESNGATLVNGADDEPFMFQMATTFRTETEIPVRPWLVPDYLMRGAVTVPFGPPDQGKSLLLTAWALALALGRPWGRFEPVGPQRVLLMLAEEDEDEQDRRFSAAMRAFGVEHGAIEPNIRRLMARDLPLLITVDQRTGILETTRGWDELTGAIEAFRPDVLVLDPLVEFHSAEENDNVQIKMVISQFRKLARDHAMAVAISHHARKGALEPGDLEALRGGSALGGAARFVFTVVEMTVEEALSLGVPEDARRYFLRLDRARGAYTAPAADAEWFEKVGYFLDNGDDAPVLRPWDAPQAIIPDQMTLARLLVAIGKGCPQAGGEPWSPQFRRDTPRSLHILFDQFGIKPISQRKTLAALKPLGLQAVKYRNGSRVASVGLRTADGLPNANWNEG